MKILFICHRFPYPPERGGKIRPFNMIRWLSAKHEVTVVSVARSQAELAAGRDLIRFCDRYEAGLISSRQAWSRVAFDCFSAKPISLGYFHVPSLREKTRDLVTNERFDLIWVHCSSMAQYVPESVDCPRVMDFGDMDSEKWLQYARWRSFPLSLIYRLEGIRLRRYERELAHKFTLCTVISPGEKRILESYEPGVCAQVIPNGVDLNFFTNNRQEHDPESVVFVGKMDYYPNVDAVEYFCRQILPLIREEVPNVRFTIVGSNPSRRVRNLGKLAGVSVTGFVRDVRPFLQTAAVSVAPLRIACGIQNKVLESMAMKVPVVASPGAFDGVDAIAGEHLLVESSPESFAAAVVSLMKNPVLRQRLAAAGRRRIEERHTWAVCLQHLDEIIEPWDAGKALASIENIASTTGNP